MSCSSRAGFSVLGSSNIVCNKIGRVSIRVCCSIGAIQFKESKSNVDFPDQKGASNFSIRSPKLEPVYAHTPFVSFPRTVKWWEKNPLLNMIDINSAQELVESLLDAGDRLVIVDFYSPGCGGCKALHPKICQIAELNPNSIFLKVNYEEHKKMCHALHVHVLPFFRFYRGSDGRVCSFSCTNATIKKFKDALSKHGTERCSLGPAKGLDETELLALASIGQISRGLVMPSSRREEGLVPHEANNKDEREDNAVPVVQA